MEVERQFISGSVISSLPPIPEEAKTARTIFENATGQILIHPDRRPASLQWISQVIPKMFMINKPDEWKINWALNIPQGSWLEFDKKTKNLSLCSLKKK